MQEERKSLPPLVESASPRSRLHLGRGIAVVLLAGAAYYYSRPLQEKYRGILAQWPGLQQSVSAMGTRVDALEEKIRAGTGYRQALEERLTGLESRAGKILRAARKHAEETAGGIERRLEARTNQRLHAVESRLERLGGEQEATREQDGVRLARLEQEIAALRQEAARQIATVRQERSGDLVPVDRNRRDLEPVRGEWDRERVPFEVSKNHSRELIPGISLRVTRTDVRYRRFDGWLWLLPDRRTVWVRGQGAQQPVVFYSKRDLRPYELVITNVAGKSVAGYLLAPRGTPPAGTPLSRLNPPHD